MTPAPGTPAANDADEARTIRDTTADCGIWCTCRSCARDEVRDEW